MAQLHESMFAFMHIVKERMDIGGVDIIGIPTGIQEIDDATGGLRNSALYVLGARPGMGKTAMALTLCINIANAGYKTMYLSMEMGAELLALRVLSGLTRIPAERIEKGKLNGTEYELLQAATERTKKANFEVMDQSTSSEAFLAHVHSVKASTGLDFLVVDYATLFRDEGKHGETERLAVISANCLEIARRLDIPVLLLVQLNRSVEMREGHIPMLSDIRNSGAIEQDAFQVWFLVREQYYNVLDGQDGDYVETDAQFIIAKNRQGPVGSWEVHYVPAEMRWKSKYDDIKVTPPPLTGLVEGSLKERVRKPRE